MLTKLIDFFWNQKKDNKNVAPDMKKVVMILPIEVTEDEFVKFRYQDAQFQQKYLTTVYNKIKELMRTNSLLVSEYIDKLPRNINHYECIVTLYCFPEDVKSLENSIQIKQNAAIFFNNIESYIISGKQIIEWNFRNHSFEKRLSKDALDELFTYRNPAYNQKGNDSKPADSKTPSSYNK